MCKLEVVVNLKLVHDLLSVACTQTDRQFNGIMSHQLQRFRAFVRRIFHSLFSSENGNQQHMKYQSYNAPDSRLPSEGDQKSGGKNVFVLRVQNSWLPERRLWLTTESSAYNMRSVLRKFMFRDQISYLLANSHRWEIYPLIFHWQVTSVNLKPYIMHAAGSNLYHERDTMGGNYHDCHPLIRINSGKILGQNTTAPSSKHTRSTSPI